MRAHSGKAMARGATLGAILCGLLIWHPAQSAERLYCFSDICLGDPPRVLETIPLRDLSSIAEKRPRPVDLKAALPGVGEDDRRLLAKRVGPDGRFLVDAQTLRIFLGVAAVCAPIAPFAAMFTSASGHATAVEFDMFKTGEDAQLGVKTVARVFTVRPGTSEYATLVADLSRKFGFRIDNPSPVHLPGGGLAMFKYGDQGFQLRFALPEMADRETVLATQRGCVSADRVPID